MPPRFDIRRAALASARLASLFLLACGQSASRAPTGAEPAATPAPVCLPLGSSPDAAPGAIADIAAIAHVIDQRVADQLRARRIAPAPPAADTAYARRVTLDLIGRIPTAQEAVAYANAREPDKRAALVARLLASPAYADHWTDIYMDLLVGRTPRVQRRFVDSTRSWLRRAFAANRPMDEIAAALLTARGDLATDGAGGFIAHNLLAGGDIADLAGKSARLFLGLQIQCAQCHDHPYDERYKQPDFAAFAAYFGEIDVRQVRDPLLGPTVEIADGSVYVGVGSRRRNPFVDVTPAFFGEAADLRPGETRRQALVRRVRRSDLLAKVYVNRTWQLLLGRAITPAWDDLGAEDDPKHPRLLSALADDFRRCGYDHRRLLAAIALTDTYARDSRGARDPHGADGPALAAAFAQAPVRPLRAEQTMRSLLVATGLADDAGERGERWATRERQQQALREFLDTIPYGAGASSHDDGADMNAAQALLMDNGIAVNQGAQAREGAVLGRILAGSQDPGERLGWMYLAALTRRPTDAERARWLAYLDARGDARAAYEDLYYALLTSTEFATNH